MKRIFPVVLLLFSLVTLSVRPAQAQFVKNTWYVDGSFNFSKKNAEGTFSRNTDQKWSISPNVGYFVHPRWLVGIGLYYQQINYEEWTEAIGAPTSPTDPITSHSTLSTQQVAPSLFVKYIQPIHEKFSFALKGSFQLGREKSQLNFSTRSSYSASSTERAYSMVALSPEILYQMTPRLGLQANFNGFRLHNYTGFTYKEKQNITEYSIDFNPGTWSFGLFYLIGSLQP